MPFNIEINQQQTDRWQLSGSLIGSTHTTNTQHFPAILHPSYHHLKHAGAYYRVINSLSIVS